MPASHSGSLIEDLIQIEHQLGLDSSKSYETLQQRDRQIGIQLKHLKNNPVKQIRAWFDLTQDDATFSQSTLSRTSFFISSCLIIIGLIAGLSTGWALFYYTGEQPINIINVLAIGVGLQLILLLAFILVALFNSQWLQNMLSGFNAGRWATRAAYFFPSLKSSLDELLDRRQSIIDQKIVKWQTVYWSQQFAVTFNVALIFCCSYLVTFTDLAFGWSTTLAFDNSVVKAITDTLSSPWKQLFPAAVPDISLIESTRFYRLKTISIGDSSNNLVIQAQLAGNWWRFLLLSLFVYGFIPRLITLVISKLQLSKAIKQSILSLPGLHLLLDRMNNPSIATTAVTPEVQATKSEPLIAQTITPLTNRDAYFLHWGQPAVEQAELENWITLNTSAKLIRFDQIASNASQSIPLVDSLPRLMKKQVIAIVVKAWEPPTLELTDWLGELRQHYGKQILIVVIPYDIAANSQIKGPDQIEKKTWHDFLQRQKLFDIEFHGARE